jgi:hypothetical protein
MSNSPWTAAEPEPGEFDRDLTALDPRYIEASDGNPTAALQIIVSVQGRDAERLERLADASGKKPSEVVSDLLRDAG